MVETNGTTPHNLLYRTASFYAKAMAHPLDNPPALSLLCVTEAFAGVCLGRRSGVGMFVAPVAGFLWGGYKGWSDPINFIALREGQEQRLKNVGWTVGIAAALGVLTLINKGFFHKALMMEETLLSAAVAILVTPMGYVSAGFLAGQFASSF